MGACVFNNQIFDSWLNRMSDEILSKVNREKITTEEMIILILKAQTNHFHHMDIEMKEDMLVHKNDLNSGMDVLRKDMNSLRNDMSSLRIDVDILKVDVDILKTDVSILKTDVNILKTDVSILKTDVNILKTDVKDLRADMNSFRRELDAKMDSRFMWTIGVTVTMSLGLYLKLFLG